MSYCSSGLPALAFYIQGNSATCTYVVYHIGCAFAAVFLIFVWCLITCKEPKTERAVEVLKWCVALVFGLEGLAILALSRLINQEHVDVFTPQPSAPFFQEITEADIRRAAEEAQQRTRSWEDERSSDPFNRGQAHGS